MNKFIGFAGDLLGNRPGIVLAASNLCYFAWNGFGSFRLLAPSIFDKMMFCQNSPAVILTIASSEFFGFLFSKSSAHYPFRLSVFLFFVTLQWLFIGWLAKTLAPLFRQDV